METAITAAFGDGEYRFWLPLPQVFELERVAGDTSILELEESLRTAMGKDKDGDVHFLGGGAAMVKDIRETIRLGLIGGNHGVVSSEQVEVGPIRAKELVELYTYPVRPLGESAVIAWRILYAAIFGVKLEGTSKKNEAGDPNPSEKDN